MMLVLITSCKKEEKNDGQISRAQLLLGEWSSTSYYFSSIDVSNSDTISVLEIEGAFVIFEFKNNNQLLTTVVGDTAKPGNYRLSSDSIILATENDTLRAYIEQLTQSRLVLDARDFNLESGHIIADSTHIEFTR